MTTESHLRWLNSTRAKRSPGKRFEYNNSGYALLALIVEGSADRATPFRRLVDRRLPAFKTRNPLGFPF